MQTSTTPPKALLVIIFGILAVSTASIFIRFAQGYASSLVIAAYRLTLASLVLGPIALRRHRDEIRALTRRDLGLAFVSGLLLALHFAAWITSLEYTSVASSVVIVTSTPLWVAILSPIVLREPVGKAVAWGMILALIGGMTVAISDSCTLAWPAASAASVFGPNAAPGGVNCPELARFLEADASLGNLLALLGAFTAAGYLLIGRNLRGKMSLLPYITVVYGLGAVALIVIMFAFGETPFGYPPVAYLWFLLLALIPQVLGHSSFNWALGYLPAAFVSIALLGEPIGATILAYIILDETPTLLKLIGAILILAGIFIASNWAGSSKSS